MPADCRALAHTGWLWAPQSQSPKYTLCTKYCPFRQNASLWHCLQFCQNPFSHLTRVTQFLLYNSPSPPQAHSMSEGRHWPSLYEASMLDPSGFGRPVSRWLEAAGADGVEGLARELMLPVTLSHYCKSQSKFESGPEAVPAFCSRTLRENSYCKVCVSKRKEYCNKCWLLWIHIQLSNYSIIYSAPMHSTLPLIYRRYS